jgi:hypothetical protein
MLWGSGLYPDAKKLDPDRVAQSHVFLNKYVKSLWPSRRYCLLFFS